MRVEASFARRRGLAVRRAGLLLLAALGAVLPGCLSVRPRAAGVGEVASLAELSPAAGRRGYWAPREFLERYGARVSFREPYDAGKIPILFVHGAAGSPGDWRYLSEHLDRRRFQPCFFSYPSGAPIARTADLLGEKLTELQVAHHPSRLYIVAHSMGGLVVRALLGARARSFPEVKLFISISTPWGGERLTDHAPPLIPSWRDLRPEGAFLKTLFRERLPADLEYDLLFGYRGARGLLRPNNDGTVTLESALRMAAQAEARRIYGFDESHAGILSSPQVVEVLNALFAEAERR